MSRECDILAQGELFSYPDRYYLFWLWDVVYYGQQRVFGWHQHGRANVKGGDDRSLFPAPHCFSRPPNERSSNRSDNQGARALSCIAGLPGLLSFGSYRLPDLAPYNQVIMVLPETLYFSLKAFDLAQVLHPV